MQNPAPVDRLCRVLELEARTVDAACKAGEAARDKAVRPGAGLTGPPGGVLWLKCARRFKKGGRSEPT